MDYSERLKIERLRVMRTRRNRELNGLDNTAALARLAQLRRVARQCAIRHLDIKGRNFAGKECDRFFRIPPTQFRASKLHSEYSTLYHWHSGNHAPECPGFGTIYSVENGFVCVNNWIYERVKARYPHAYRDPDNPCQWVLFELPSFA